MDVQLPLYRAKKIDSDEWVEGYLIPMKEEINTNPVEAGSYFVISTIIDSDYRTKDMSIKLHEEIDIFRIYESTLAIHFPDMIDSEGNKIFASLSESGKGGDICYHPTVSNEDLNGVVAYNRGRFSINNGLTPKWSRLVVEGIKK